MTDNLTTGTETDDAAEHPMARLIEQLDVGFKEMDVQVLLAFQVGGKVTSSMILGTEEDAGTIQAVKSLLDGEIDTFLKALIAHASKHGHNSVILKAMGVPEK